jgi:hypothetical protein
MANFEGNVSWVSGKDGSLELRARSEGRWNADNVSDMIKALSGLARDTRVSHWSIWLDLGLPEGDRKPMKVSELLAFCKTADKIELVLVKRPFPQPKLKLTRGAGKAKSNAKVVL